MAKTSAVIFVSCILVAMGGFVPKPRHTRLDNINLNLEDSPISCSKYVCKPDNMTFTPDQCIWQKDDTYYIQPCDQSGTKTYCHTDWQKTNITCMEPLGESFGLGLHGAYPGEICRGHADCNYGDCVNDICQGLNANDPCTEHIQCNPGLRCLSNICVPQLTKSEEGCYTDEDCQSNLGCNKTELFHARGTCIPYFSVQNGEFVSTCDTNYEISDLCASGYCQNIGYFATEGQCVEAPMSAFTPPKACTTNGNCLGVNNKAAFRGICQCGYNDSGQGYCAPFPGDRPGLEYLSSLKQLAASGSLSKCNTARRFADHCWLSADPKRFADLEFYKYGYIQYTKVIENSDCVRKTYTDFYWQGNMAAIGAALALLGLLF